MAKTYTRIATVEFAIPFTDQRVTVSDLEFTYKAGDDSDLKATLAASKFLRSQGFNAGLDVVSICTRPKKVAPLVQAINASDRFELVHVS